VTVTNTYGSLDRVVTRGFPDGGVEHFFYDGFRVIQEKMLRTFLSSYFLPNCYRKNRRNMARAVIRTDVVVSFAHGAIPRDAILGRFSTGPEIWRIWRRRPNSRRTAFASFAATLSS
jgi:hypothetical protein